MRKRVGRRSSEVLRNMQKAVLSGTLNIARTLKIATWEDYVFLVYTQFYFYLTVFFFRILLYIQILFLLVTSFYYFTPRLTGHARRPGLLVTFLAYSRVYCYIVIILCEYNQKRISYKAKT